MTCSKIATVHRSTMRTRSIGRRIWKTAPAVVRPVRPVPSQWLAEGLFNVFKRFSLRLMFLRNVPHGAMAFQPLDEPVPIYVDA